MSFEYKIQDHGVEHAQYFQGAGVAFTRFSDIATGSGSSAKEAGEDALEMFWQQVDKTKITIAEAEALSKEIDSLSTEEDAHDGCCDDGDEAFEEGRRECESAHRISIRWRYDA